MREAYRWGDGAVGPGKLGEPWTGNKTGATSQRWDQNGRER